MRRIPFEVLAIGSILLEIPPLFLLYVIIKKSPEKMKFIRLFLLKTVICEAILTHSLLWGYWPDVFNSYFPLPLLKVSSLFEYLGDFGAVLALVIFLVSGALSLLGVFEGCIMRCGITYNIPVILKFSNGIPFVIFQLVELIVIIGIPSSIAHLVVQGMPGLEQFSIKYGAYHLLDEFDVKRDVVIFIDPYSTIFWYIMYPVCGCFLIFVPFALCVLTYLTHRKITENAQLMSTENYFLQKRLTYMVLAQTVLPIVLVFAPICALAFAIITVFSSMEMDSSRRSMYDHTTLGFPIICTLLTLYPLINTMATIAIIRPYRVAIFELIPCTRRVRTRPLTYGIPNK